jgi:quercetin dioxygenase-like cupin family protein
VRANQTIRNNATGETLTMLVGEQESGGAYQLYEVTLPPHRPSPPLHYHTDFTETFTVKQGKLDIYLDREQRHILLHPGDSATAQIRQLHRFANNRDEPVTFTMETRPAGGVVKAFQLAYGVANAGGAAKDGLPANPLARLVFVKISQGYLPGVPLLLQRFIFTTAAIIARWTGLQRRLQAYIS